MTNQKSFSSAPVARGKHRGIAGVPGMLRGRRVDFLIAGAQKSGTTTLDSYLRGHRHVCMAVRKEVHFFDNERWYRKKLLRYPLYHSYFHLRRHHRLLGESTPHYLYWLDAPKRIWRYNPRMKFIIILRNPIQRAFSDWNMERVRGAERLAFAKALAVERERARRTLPLQDTVFSYMDKGYYTAQLRRLWRFFPEQQVLVLKTDDLLNAPTTTLRRVTDFLGLDALPAADARREYAMPYSEEMSADARRRLVATFTPEIRALEVMLDWDLRDWLR